MSRTLKSRTLKSRTLDLCTTLVALAGLAATSTSQGKPPEKASEAWQLDPYTKGDKEAMARAGYVSFGPFPWGDHHDTATIRKIMPEVKLIFVETAHFRIGSSLPEVALPKDGKLKRRLIDDLKALKKKLPLVRGSERKLDPWLRLHLYAMRLENLYQEWQQLLQVTDEDFPQEKTPADKVSQDPTGRGPYLGMQEKFTVLMFKKPENLFRYCKSTGWNAAKEPIPAAINFMKLGSLFYGTATDFKDIPLTEDHQLHCALVHSVSQNLLNGYCFYRHGLPAWLRDGLPNLMLRRLDPDKHAFSGLKDGSLKDEHDPKWERNTRRVLENGFATGFSELCRVEHGTGFTLNDHMVAWSLCDYLAQLDGGKPLARFLRVAKAPVPTEPGKTALFSAVLAAQDKACKDAFGCTLEELRDGWEKYVRKRYPRR